MRGTYAHYMRQVYLTTIPLYPLGYLVVQNFRDGFFFTKFYVKRDDLKPSDHLKQLVENEFDRIEDPANPLLRLHLTDSLKPRTYGSFHIRNGAEIQLPVAMSFVDIEYAQRLGGHIEMDLGRSRNARKVETGSPVAEELLTRMMLSENAKKFVIQRELQRANDGLLFCLPMIGWGAIAGAGYPFFLFLTRFIGYAASLAVSVIGTTAVFRQFLKQADGFETLRLDEKTVKLDKEYEEGAKDYLTSQMIVNRMLRKVMGEESEARISKSGDLLSDAVPYSLRLRAINRLKLKTERRQERNQQDISD